LPLRRAHTSAASVPASSTEMSPFHASYSLAWRAASSALACRAASSLASCLASRASS
jgi:hypothetical protein